MGAEGSWGAGDRRRGRGPGKKLGPVGVFFVSKNCLSTWGPSWDLLAGARVGIGTNQGSLKPLVETWRAL